MPQLFSVVIGGHQQMVTKDVMLRERKKHGDLLGGNEEETPVEETELTPEPDVAVEEPKVEVQEQILETKEDVKEEEKTEVLEEEKPKFSFFSDKDKKEEEDL